ncbi:SIS domain-containing protein [Propionibacteriaceae bacterium Y1685]|uniref:SIS domain-containing protein n=1 Tax=Microlunatus sp. Y1700 TaxID=3418487 RepID=UPI003B7D3713
MTVFDDSLLEDERVLAAADPALRQLAEAGSRLRIEAAAAESGLSALNEGRSDRPRAVIAVGAEARLVRALLEPVCPVPFVAWPVAGLPGWVGPLDLVVVLAAEAADVALVATAREAVRRGARLIIACPDSSPLAEHGASASTTLLTTRTADSLAASVVVLEGLCRLGLGPRVAVEQVAEIVDDVARRCSPHTDLATNPGKELALAVGDAQPLVWGGSVLAARASRRIAEGLRLASGRPALAADADALLPVIETVAVKDPFADPFDQPEVRPVLVVLDDGNSEAWIRAARGRLMAAAERHDVRVSVVEADQGEEIDRYAALLQQGLYGCRYLAVGLGRHGDRS